MERKESQISLTEGLNPIDRCVQFTSEVKNDNSLSFPETLVSKHIDQFLMIVLRKSFSISRHAFSNHPPQQKITAFYT